MKLYHGSNLAVEEPRIINRYTTLDFGTGFYTTPNEEQAQEFARKVYVRRGRAGVSTVSVFDFDEDAASVAINIRRFSTPDHDWLAFIVQNRRTGRYDDSLDLIIGPVADDDVFTTIALYEAGELDEEAAIKRFKIKNLYCQYLFCNGKALKFLQYTHSYTLETSHEQ
jgi:hypothetical protein